MRGYRIYEEDGKFRFLLIPSNNKDQEIGSSVWCDSAEACLQAVERFRRIVVKNRINNWRSPHVRLVETKKENDTKEYHLEFYADKKPLYCSRRYTTRENCKKHAQTLCQHIDEYTLRQV